MFLRPAIENRELGPGTSPSGLNQGHAFYSLNDYARAAPPGTDLAEDLKELQTSYEDLELDPYMKDGGKYRFRRFARFSLDSKTGGLSRLALAPFFQSQQINALNGGIARTFSPIKNKVLENPLLHAIIRFQFSLLPEGWMARNWRVFVHQIRILAMPDQTGKPTPEGIHQDGHHYVGMVLFNRINVLGGESRIFDLDRNLRVELTLKNPLDTLVVDDRAVFHEVTSITSTDPSSHASRDMLLIDFNPEVPS